MPVDSFFEWRAVMGARAKQPYVIAMKDRSPFGLAGLWENWRNGENGNAPTSIQTVVNDLDEQFRSDLAA